MPAERRYREDDRESRLRPQLSEAAVLRLYASHETDGVEERWGGRPERLIIEAR